MMINKTVNKHWKTGCIFIDEPIYYQIKKKASFIFTLMIKHQMTQTLMEEDIQQ